jgi:hypothetical protein
MKKMAILLVVLVIVSVGFLSGCSEKSDEEPTLIGSWKGDQEGGIYVFRDNGTVEIRSTDSEGYGISGKYTVNGDIINVTLTITIIEEEVISWEMKYEFLSYDRVKFTYLTGEAEDSIEYYQRV